MNYTKDHNYAQLTLSLQEAEELERLIWRALNTYPDVDVRDRWANELFPVEVA